MPGVIYELGVQTAASHQSFNSHQLTSRTLLNRYSSSNVISTLALLGSIACAASKDAPPSPTPEPIPSQGSATALAAQPTPSAVASSASSTPATGIVGSSTTAGTAKDSAPKPPPITVPTIKGRTKKDSLALVAAVKAGLANKDWPVKTAAPLPGAILPAKRIVAYYGNPLSKKMGILGELPPEQMLAKFDKEIAAWNKADPARPVQPALHLIAVVAQGSAGRDGKYRLRMTDSLINLVYGWAQTKNALLFLDVQVGLSTVQEELPRLIPFLQRPNVMLALDPEFSMKSGDPPGKRIGSMSSADVNYAIKLLSGVAKQYNLPPKVLVVHRFTRGMLTDAKGIKLDPRVQVVINMDGWGQPWLKYDSYRAYVEAEPVEYTGFKLFYKNDTRKGDPLLTPAEVLMLNPKPLYIQYQ